VGVQRSLARYSLRTLAVKTVALSGFGSSRKRADKRFCDSATASHITWTCSCSLHGKTITYRSYCTSRPFRHALEALRSQHPSSSYMSTQQMRNLATISPGTQVRESVVAGAVTGVTIFISPERGHNTKTSYVQQHFRGGVYSELRSGRVLSYSSRRQDQVALPSNWQVRLRSELDSVVLSRCSVRDLATLARER